MMKKKPGIMLLSASYILLLLVMFILPVSRTDYSVISNTLDDLGAQSAPFAWLLNLTIISLSAGSVFSGWSYFEGHIFQRSLLILSGISQVLAAVFNHAPINPHISYNLTESGLHEYFACSGVLSFAFLSITTAFILERHYDKLLSAMSGVSSIILLIMTSESDKMAGIWNRLLLIIVFGWMIYFFRTAKISKL